MTQPTFTCKARFMPNAGKKSWTIVEAWAVVERNDTKPVLVIESVNGDKGHAIPLMCLKKIISGKQGEFSFRYTAK
jgi:hypothetical protein